MTDALDRIAAALERMAPPPPPPPADARAHPAYLWRDGRLGAARAWAPTPLDLLVGIEPQKGTVLEQMRRLAAGLPAHDVLLWGARGSGKSALVKAAVASVQADGGALALVEVGPDGLASLPDLFSLIADTPRGWALFLDDLGFAEGDGAPRLLRSLLEGGAEARPANVRLFVTANRRHVLPRQLSEEQGALAPRDAADDALALADRFGLSLGFHRCDQDTFLAMVSGYAARHDLAFAREEALAWATGRGGPSGRVAWQYVVELAGRAGRRL